MSSSPLRLTVFAGPNGSGKSTLKEAVPAEQLGVYVNADEIERQLRERGGVVLAGFHLRATTAEVRAFFSTSPFAAAVGLGTTAVEVSADGLLCFPGLPVAGYLAANVADFIRKALIKARVSFSFETVMSSPDKVELMAEAQACGYHVDLYFVTVADPVISVARVRNRVRLGGHAVPEDKIVSRYRRALENLPAAIRASNQAYIYDNSGLSAVLLAEVSHDSPPAMGVLRLVKGVPRLTMRVKNEMPAWFKSAVWDPLYAPAN